MTLYRLESIIYTNILLLSSKKVIYHLIRRWFSNGRCYNYLGRYQAFFNTEYINTLKNSIREFMNISV